MRSARQHLQHLVDRARPVLGDIAMKAIEASVVGTLFDLEELGIAVVMRHHMRLERAAAFCLRLAPSATDYLEQPLPRHEKLRLDPI